MAANPTLAASQAVSAHFAAQADDGAYPKANVKGMTGQINWLKRHM
jgi:hypothetical protein